MNNKVMDKFAALSEPKRRRMIELIAMRGEMAATAISEQFSISAPAVSQHLKVLREAEIVTMRKQAQQRIYRINTEGIDDMWEWLGQMRAYWEQRFDALDELLQAEQDDNEA